MDIAETYSKQFIRVKAKTHQLMLELEVKLTIVLIHRGKLLVGFLACNIKITHQL